VGQVHLAQNMDQSRALVNTRSFKGNELLEGACFKELPANREREFHALFIAPCILGFQKHADKLSHLLRKHGPRAAATRMCLLTRHSGQRGMEEKKVVKDVPISSFTS
jgi:hypothetical protein